MKKIKYTRFFIEKYLIHVGHRAGNRFCLIGREEKGYEKIIGTFYDFETANFIKKLLTATLIKKGK